LPVSADAAKSDSKKPLVGWVKKTLSLSVRLSGLQCSNGKEVVEEFPKDCDEANDIFGRKDFLFNDFSTKFITRRSIHYEKEKCFD
jgi:hypothetical protein